LRECLDALLGLENVDGYMCSGCGVVGGVLKYVSFPSSLILEIDFMMNGKQTNTIRNVPSNTHHPR
jgi:hypothetical protein